jgi:disulfide bond formation protein DsbB
MTLKKEYYLYLAFLMAWVSMVGSLFFSEILKYPPCVLCWYQRIAMYPLVVILIVGILKKAADVHLYALPLAISGAAIAFYHNLLYYKILPESAAPCIQGVSCTTKYIEYFGFITIPLLSLLGFIFIIVCLLMYHRN